MIILHKDLILNMIYWYPEKNLNILIVIFQILIHTDKHFFKYIKYILGGLISVQNISLVLKMTSETAKMSSLFVKHLALLGKKVIVLS